VSLQIAIRQYGDVTILDLRGRSTVSDGESESLRGRLQSLLDGGVGKLLLDLTNLSQVDSSGLSVIATTYVSLTREGGCLGFLRPRGRVREVLSVLHLLEVVPCFENEAEAVASLRARCSIAKHA